MDFHLFQFEVSTLHIMMVSLLIEWIVQTRRQFRNFNHLLLVMRKVFAVYNDKKLNLLLYNFYFEQCQRHWMTWGVLTDFAYSFADPDPLGSVRIFRIQPSFWKLNLKAREKNI